jgi:hypothetical protein
MAKKIIKITENDLHRLIKESVEKVLKEANWSNALTDPNDVDPFETEDDYDENPLDKWKRDKEDGLI